MYVSLVSFPPFGEHVFFLDIIIGKNDVLTFNIDSPKWLATRLHLAGSASEIKQCISSRCIICGWEIISIVREKHQLKIRP